MKKEKGTKEKGFTFNPSEYDYLDDLPIQGWIWEFIRRSNEYKGFYQRWEQEIVKGPLDKTPLFAEYIEKFFPIMPQNPNTTRFQDEDPFFILKGKVTKLVAVHGQ